MQTAESPEGKFRAAVACYIGDQKQSSKYLRALLQDVPKARRYDLFSKVYGGSEGALVLHTAAARGDQELVQSTLEFVDEHERLLLLKQEDGLGNSALSNAATYGKVEPLEYMLHSVDYETRFEILNQANAEGMTALCRAAEKGKRKILQTILNSVKEEHRNKLLLAQNNDGDTAVMLTAEAGHARSLLCLIENMDKHQIFRTLKTQNKMNQSVVHKAAWFGHSNILNTITSALSTTQAENLLMMPDKLGNTALLSAASNGHAKAVFQILNSTAAELRYKILSQKNKNGRTAINRAAFNGHVDVVHEVLNAVSTEEKCALLLQRDDSFDDTPITLAACNGHCQAVKYILSAVDSDMKIKLMMTTNRRGQTPLHLAGLNGHTTVIESIVNSIAESQLLTLLLLHDSDGVTALSLAGSKGHVATIKKILMSLNTNQRYELIKEGGNHFSALHLAAETGQTNVITAYFNLISDEQKQDMLFLTDGQGNTACSMAAFHGNVKALSKMLQTISPDKMYDLLNSQNNRGQSPLHLAALFGHAEVIKALLHELNAEQRSCLLFLQDHHGDSALFLSACHGHTDAVQKLLRYAKPAMMMQLVSLQNSNGSSVLHGAVQRDNVDMIEIILSKLTQQEKQNVFMLQDTDGNTAMSMACCLENMDAVQCIRDFTDTSNMNFLLTIQNIKGRTAIHHIASNGRVDSLRILLQNFSQDAIFNLFMFEDNEGDTALALALSKQNFDVAHYMLTTVTVHQVYHLLIAPNDTGRSPFHITAYRGEAAIVRLALHQVKDDEVLNLLSVKDDEGNSVIGEAVAGGCPETVQCVITAIPPSHRLSMLATINHDGKTCFHMGATHGHFKAIEAALHHSTEVEIYDLLAMQDKSGMNALCEAANRGHTDGFKQFLHHLSPGLAFKIVSLKTRHGSTVLHYAARQRCVEEFVYGLDVLMEQDKMTLLAMEDNEGQTAYQIAKQLQISAKNIRDRNESDSEYEDLPEHLTYHSYQNVDGNDLSQQTFSLPPLSAAPMNISPFPEGPNIIHPSNSHRKDEHGKAIVSKMENQSEELVQNSDPKINGKPQPAPRSSSKRTNIPDYLVPIGVMSDAFGLCSESPQIRERYSATALNEDHQHYASIVSKAFKDLLCHNKDSEKSCQATEMNPAATIDTLTDREMIYMKRIIELEDKNITAELVNETDSASENKIKNMVEVLHQDTVMGIYSNLGTPDDKHMYAQLLPEAIKSLFCNIKDFIYTTPSPEINSQMAGSGEELTVREQALLNRILELEELLSLKQMNVSSQHVHLPDTNVGEYVTKTRYSGIPKPPDNKRPLLLMLGDRVQVYDSHETHWWFGSSGDKQGYFPASYVKWQPRKLAVDEGKMDEGRVDVGKGCIERMNEQENEEQKEKDQRFIERYKSLEGQIRDIAMPAGVGLQDYGRLIMEGKIHVQFHDEKTKSERYVVLMDKVMLICKTSGSRLSYRTAFILSDHQLKVASSSTLQWWRHAFMLVNRFDNKAVTFFAKDGNTKSDWIEAINLANEHFQPPFSKDKGFDFIMATFPEHSKCDVCGMFLPGLFYQGYQCTRTQKKAHRQCIERLVKGDHSKDQPDPLSQWNSHSMQNPSGRDTPETPKESNDGYLTVRCTIQLAEYPWYVERCSKLEASQMLYAQRTGVFLVRESEKSPGSFAIGVMEEGKAKHFRISQRGDMYSIGDTESFTSIPDLVDFYHYKSLNKVFEDLNTSLLIPYKERPSDELHISPKLPGDADVPQAIVCVARVLHDYETSEPNQISLNKGEVIAVYGKKAEAKGWWKGSVVRNGKFDKLGYFPKSYVTEIEGDAVQLSYI